MSAMCFPFSPSAKEVSIAVILSVFNHCTRGVGRQITCPFSLQFLKELLLGSLICIWTWFKWLYLGLLTDVVMVCNLCRWKDCIFLVGEMGVCDYKKDCGKWFWRWLQQPLSPWVPLNEPHLKRLEPISLPLESGWPCDFLWPRECGPRDVVQLLRSDLQSPCTFCFSLKSTHSSIMRGNSV